MARAARTHLIPTGLFLAAAARVRMASVSKLGTFKYENDVRRIYRNDVLEVLAAHRDADRQESMIAEKLAPIDTKIAKFTGKLDSDDAEIAELALEMLEVLGAERNALIAELAEVESARLLQSEIDAARSVAQERTSGSSDWAAAARELLSAELIDICDMRAVGCLSRAACKN